MVIKKNRIENRNEECVKEITTPIKANRTWSLKWV